MLIRFLMALRQGGVKASLKELLVLLKALDSNLVFANLDDFYLLSRLCLVKDESQFDKFDRAFGRFFAGLDNLDGMVQALIPDEWTRAQFLKTLTEEEKARVKSLGGLEKLLDEFQKRLEEQQKRHQGGNKWIGTGGTSPFGNSGYHPGGIRVGGSGGGRSAAKVWERREYRNFDDQVELGTRGLKVALRKLRRFARTGAEEELDLDHTIRATADNGGLLDVKMVPERHNAIKVLLFLDVGGSMDGHVKVCEELFSACRAEFKHLKYFYFHNFVYDKVWRDNLRRNSNGTPLWEILRTYGRDYKVIFVGDASMGPYEIMSPYGSIEVMNEEPGAVWMARLTSHFDKVIWLNPVAEPHWQYTQSIGVVRELVGDQMFPLTLAGLDSGIKALK